MYEFLEQNSIYVVMTIVLMVWSGVFLYLLRIDGQVRKLESKK
ncbi:MAG: CcmD family protein [Ignavibacteria bacterium]|jgi:CcmD family protein|nr:CcmD family protein [Ignavibacteria bacterium]